MKALIFGAGSIGNHMAYACTYLGWEVHLYDPDKEALSRTRNEIYPSRYGYWNDEIRLLSEKPTNYANFDLNIVGTPPDIHTKLAIDIIDNGGRAVLIEKPLTYPGDKEVNTLRSKASSGGVQIFVGYNHSVSPSFEYFMKMVGLANKVSSLEEIICNWRENWEGIFNAHPWLSGPSDSYLGFSNRGGGAAYEHSHGLHMMIYTLDTLGRKIDHTVANTNMITEAGSCYDESIELSMIDDAHKKHVYRSDVITWPAEKNIEVSFTKNNKVAWTINHKTNQEEVTSNIDGVVLKSSFDKSRPFDFIYEISHIENIIKGRKEKTSLDLNYADKVQQLLSNIFE